MDQGWGGVAQTVAEALPALWSTSGPWERVGWLSVVPLCLALLRAPKETVKELGSAARALVGVPVGVVAGLRDLLRRSP